MTAPDPRQDPLLKLTLRCGSVYYFQDRHFTSHEPHYFIVVNAKPLKDSSLLMVVSSSDINKVKERWYNLPNTLVLVTPQEYKGFHDISIIDCNTIIERPHSLLLEKRREKQLGQYLNDFPQPVLAKVIAAIHNSPIHKPTLKARIPSIL